VFNAVGRSVYADGGTGVLCVSNAPPPPIIRPGHSEAWTDGPWDQLGRWAGPCQPGNCHPTRTHVPPGMYRITWRWLDTLSVSTAWFWIT
jgi:hypothetical protein